ncbi:MAG TPA: aldo/keto reductase [Pseudonocardiaceae bacterium]|jgi:aryl-alcohol dehydrogenase-like predicted oxidoreductase
MPDGNVASAEVAGTIDVGGDLTVHRLGFGAMRITGDGIWGPPADRDEARAVLRRAVELGVNFIDTADSYGPHVSEELIGETLHPYADGLVIATKGGLERTGPGQWPVNGRPEHLVGACEGSLRRLKLDQIPLYQFHRPDPAVPLEDSIGALVTLKEQGKIRHIGLSNVTEDQLRQAQRLTPIVSIQNRYNLGDRHSESLVDLCEQERLVFLPWAPIQNLDDNRAVREIAQHHGAAPRQIVLAWLLARSPAMLPIPGTGTVAHLEDNVAAAAIELAPDEIATLTRNARSDH